MQGGRIGSLDHRRFDTVAASYSTREALIDQQLVSSADLRDAAMCAILSK